MIAVWPFSVRQCQRAMALAGVCVLALMSMPAAAAAYDDFISAVKAGNGPEVVSWLKRGMDPNTLDPTGQPVLHLAAREGVLAAVQALAIAEIDLNRRNAAGESAMMLGALQGHLAVVKFLVAKNAQVNHPGWTPLIYAATSGHNDIVKLLLENHAYIDAISSSGVTALMMAVRGGHRATVKLLIDEGADLTVKNDVGESALTWAERRQDAELSKLFRVRLMP